MSFAATVKCALYLYQKLEKVIVRLQNTLQVKLISKHFPPSEIVQLFYFEIQAPSGEQTELRKVQVVAVDVHVENAQIRVARVIDEVTEVAVGRCINLN